MRERLHTQPRSSSVLVHGALTAVTIALVAAALAAPASAQSPARAQPRWSQAVAFDTTVGTLRDLAARYPKRSPSERIQALKEIRAERGPTPVDRGFSGDGAVQARAAQPAPSIPSTIANFEGLSNQDNFAIFGGRVNPPDPDGDVGPNHYVELINLVLGIYSKTGTRLLGPVDIGALWAGFAVTDCTDASGDPIVLYDQFVDRWILTQFTTSGLENSAKPFWNCVAISTSGDPTGTYYRYAFETKNFQFFPDYPKYGVWTDSYVITTREFGPTVEYGIGVYALEKDKIVSGRPDARAVSFFLDGNAPGMLPLVGDGLLPADVDGKDRPTGTAAIPLVGTQDSGGGYGATFDALNVWDLAVQWRATPNASLALATQLRVASFDSIFPCSPTARDCLPQPGVASQNRYLDILSYRQRPTWRLAYRNFKDYEALVTNQAVEAAPGVAGIRWYEIRGTGTSYSVYQQSTFAPGDGVHRWMGSIAQDKTGNTGLGYSVVNDTNVFPGIRYTGRLAGDPLGQMTQGEGIIIDGTGAQTTKNSRWGDYTSLNVDPADDCTFWYVNEYYTAAGEASSEAGWQTRIGSFKLPGCQ
jgi:hypothetical protein